MPEHVNREEELRELATRLGFSLSEYTLLDRALTHASTASESSDPQHNYEALEFLGDAVLGLAVAHYLYERIPDRTPGEYSRMRAAVVNRRSLAAVAIALDIAPAIQLGKGEEQAGGRGRKALLADCLEALIGALYLDRGWKAARSFVARVFDSELEAARATDRLWDYKSRLQNHCQAERIALPRFMVVRAEGPDHDKRFDVEVILRGDVVGSGTGLTKKEAEQNAACVALKHEGLILSESEENVSQTNN